jgi:hypothetical protein
VEIGSYSWHPNIARRTKLGRRKRSSWWVAIEWNPTEQTRQAIRTYSICLSSLACLPRGLTASKSQKQLKATRTFSGSFLRWQHPCSHIFVKRITPREGKGNKEGAEEEWEVNCQMKPPGMYSVECQVGRVEVVPITIRSYHSIHTVGCSKV